MPFTTSEVPVPVDSVGELLLGAGAPLGVPGVPGLAIFPPETPPDGTVALPVTAAAFILNASRVLCAYCGGLMTITIPCTQCGFGLFWGQ